MDGRDPNREGLGNLEHLVAFVTGIPDLAFDVGGFRIAVFSGI